MVAVVAKADGRMNGKLMFIITNFAQFLWVV
jgi:hypothetical protein